MSAAGMSNAGARSGSRFLRRHLPDVEVLVQLYKRFPLGGRPGLGGTVGLGHEDHSVRSGVGTEKR